MSNKSQSEYLFYLFNNLAVNESVKMLYQFFTFKPFLDSLYVLFNRPPKNQNELKEIL